MSQQAKDIYSGIKKIFPGARPSESDAGSSSRSCAAYVDDAAADDDDKDARAPKKDKKKRRPSSFSFSSWKPHKDKHRAASEPTPAVVMSLPYGATAATPRAAPESDKGPPRTSLTQTLNQAFHSGPRRSFFGKTSSSSSYHKAKRPSRAAAFSSTSFDLASQPPPLGSRSVSATHERRTTTCTLRNSDVMSTSATVCTATSGYTSFRAVKTPPSSYQSSSTSMSSLTAPSRETATIVLSPRKPRGKKSRGMSLSFSSAARREKKKEHERPALGQRSLDSKTHELVRPHAPTWDSDSEDDYEDTKRPTRGLDRRSQSMDFMEQAPTHLISKIWRKLPLQARLIGGRGNVDLDLQKDRVSFTRSSEARKFALAAQQAKAAELHRRSLCDKTQSSPDPTEDMLSPGVAKRTRFSATPRIIASDANDGASGAYTALESYDDVLVRVCKFGAHDQRPTTTKVQEFLERSMAFLHGTRTKHGNVVTISNGEIRMWRRLALHDWTLEEVTTAQAAAALGVKGKDVAPPSSRSNSTVTDGTDSDSDSHASERRRRRSSGRCASVVEEEPEEEQEDEEDEELTVPSHVKLTKLCDVVNCCVNFGEVLFTPEEVTDLVRLEFIVEEDGWI
ncbi:hypothetical protein PsorP6_015746 [Peronosclerospora sorghi]|uniref:Uncharacterized protein n=1 Tax=Peronosclerospora sorghi TaxID=230839 RepID=A0ACC0WPB6_9STRA|nr:hypothetical protein PsorP6_015746 [Peronosclerospora sorghi]